VNLRDRLEILLLPGQNVTEIEPGIWTVDTTLPAQAYDRRAAAYDRLIGSNIYNRLMWGTTPKAYREFAQALHEAGPRVVLDAGSGSMAATAEIHAKSGAFVIGVDLSLAMLRKAKERLEAAGARNVALLQADLRDLPFRNGSFEGGLFMGMMHLFQNSEPILTSIQRVMQPNARLHMTSLAKVGRRFGDRYYETLHRMGEVAKGRNPVEIAHDLEDIYAGVSVRNEGNMVFATAFR
jgi:ubiquinone/menaquinone biosynthesis C-methylase UbiE